MRERTTRTHRWARCAVLAGLIAGLVATSAACTSGGGPDAGSPTRPSSPHGTPVATIGPRAGGDSAGPASGGAAGTTGGAAGSAGSSADKPGGSEGAALGQAAPVLGSTSAPAVLTRPLPQTAAANHALVEGFPTAIVPVPDGATVVSSSVAALDDRLQVGLEASTSAEPAAVLEHYLGTLLAEGFASSDSPALPGTTAVAFARGQDGLVLTMSARAGGGTELSVAGTLVAVG